MRFLFLSDSNIKKWESCPGSAISLWGLPSEVIAQPYSRRSLLFEKIIHNVEINMYICNCNVARFGIVIY